MSNTVSRWVPTTNLMTLRRLGKLGEELGELAMICAVCIEQGNAAYDLQSNCPAAGSVTREIADVLAQCKVTKEVLGLNLSRIQSLREALTIDHPATRPSHRDHTAAELAGFHANVRMQSAIGNAINVASRCVIQGIDEIDPGSGVRNRDRLERAIAGIEHACLVLTAAMELSPLQIVMRAAHKERLMQTWEGMFTTTEVHGELPTYPGFYWHVPTNSARPSTVVEKRDGEAFVRFTGDRQRPARPDDRFVGPIEKPR